MRPIGKSSRSGPGARTHAQCAKEPVKRPTLQTVKSQGFPLLPDVAAAIAPSVLRAVLRERKRLAPALAQATDVYRLTAGDREVLAHSFQALLRWWGWLEPLRLTAPREQLLLAALLDSSELGPLARIWAGQLGLRSERLVPVGDAPNWTIRAGALKQFMEGRPVNADPWRLFPDWFRDQLPVPPGDATPKERRLSFLAALQMPEPLWVAARTTDERAVWNELRDAGLKPWIHRRQPTAARLPRASDLSRLGLVGSGRLVVQDLASQAVGFVCDPDAGERWWDVRGDSGLHALHLAALMGGKGLVVCTFERERLRQPTARRLRSYGFSNIATRQWDGQHPPGKRGSFDGVLIDAECSGVGSWRRYPDARWVVSREDLPVLAARQLQMLQIACKAVRPGGTLVYTALTVTRIETGDLVDRFLSTHPEFTLSPFPHPLEDATTAGTLQLWSHLHDGASRFIARMMRTGAARNPD
jgi:16S rRNA (cytosine967-C5)-methyltransferase